MKILHIAYYTIKQKFKYSIVIMVIFPLFLIGTLGNCLKEVYTGKTTYNECIDVLSRNQSDYINISRYINSTDAFKNKIIIKRVSSQEDGIKNLKNRKSDAYVYINKGNLKLYLREKNDDLNSSIVKSFVYAYKASLIKGKHNYGNLIEKVYVATTDARYSSIQYYSVTMLVMIILYGAEFGVKAAAGDMKKGIEPRIESLPIKRYCMALGKIIGLTTILVIDSLVILITTKLTYGTNWGNDYYLILFFVVFFSLFAVSLGMCIQLIVRNKNISSYIIQIAVPICTILSGGYMDRRLLGDELTRISALSPSYAAQNILFQSMYGYEPNVQRFCLEILILDVIFLGAALLLARRSSN